MSEHGLCWRIGRKRGRLLILQPRHFGTTRLTPVEVKQVIAALSRAEWLRLHKVARALCRDTRFDADDLLQEAFQRALDGTRNCTRSLNIVHFLVGVMRSIAYDWRKARKRRPKVSPVTRTGALEDVVVQVRDNNLVAEELLARSGEAARQKEAILALFADDNVAQRMLEGIMDGVEGAELRSLTGLSETQFASK